MPVAAVAGALFVSFSAALQATVNAATFDVAVPGLVMQVSPATFSHQAAQSVAADASVVGARLQVECPAVPPLLVQQTMVCHAQKLGADARQFDVTVSLQRLNGWIDWRVDDWMLFTQESPYVRNGRAMCRGTIFGRDGRRVADIVQEGLLRLG